MKTKTEIKCPTCKNETMTINEDAIFCSKCGMWLKHAWITETSKQLFKNLLEYNRQMTKSKEKETKGSANIPEGIEPFIDPN